MRPVPRVRGAVSVGLFAAAVVAGSAGAAAAQNPCPATPTESAVRNAFASARPPLEAGKRLGFIDDGAPWGVLDSIWNHRTAVERGLLRPVAATVSNEDVGEIAVLQDEGDLFRAANVYDLRDVTLRFAANDDGGYDVTHLGAAAWRSSLGDALTLGDDDSAPLALAFDFPFYAGAHDSAFVNSDGNITFEEGDSASTARSVSRLLSGPPRVAPFLSDLDPSAGGGVYSQAGADAATVTWCDVPAFESGNTTTVQVSLLSTGVIEMTFDPDIATRGRDRRPLPGTHDRVRVGRPERHRGRPRRRGGGRGALCRAWRARHGGGGPEVPADPPGRLRPDRHLDRPARTLRGVRLRGHHRQPDSGHRTGDLRHSRRLRERLP